MLPLSIRAVAALGLLALASVGLDQRPRPAATATAPIDPQAVQDQAAMTWADYHPIPRTTWADPSLVPGRALRVALVAIDFEDQPFVISLPTHSDPFGNPQVDPVPRDRVPRFYADFLGVPGELNHGHTIHEYWMEQSRGQVGSPAVVVSGPYRMPRRLVEYGSDEHGAASGR